MPFVPDTTTGGRFVPDNIDSDFAKGDAHLRIPGAGKPPMPGEEPGAADTMLMGAPEAGLSMATGTAGAAVGNVAGLIRAIASGKFGTQEGVQEGGELASKVREAMTYQPRGPSGKKALRTVGELVDESKIAGLNPGMAMGAAAPGAGGAARRAAGAGARRVGDVLEDAAEQEGFAPRAAEAPAMAGVGSAETDVARMRRERAAGLPVPLKLSKGEAARDFDQLRFERETAKSGAGKPIREHLAQNNENILRNFDTWVEQTGAEAPTLRATGQTVDAALVAKAERAKARINEAYTKARAAGEMAEQVPTTDLVAFVEKNRSAARNAPVIASVEDELVRLGGAVRGKDGALTPGRMSVNDLEELRQMIGKLAEPGTPNAVFGREAKAAIDGATETASGNLFKEARRLRSAYAKEFEDRAVVAKLLDKKRGSADRAVAFEDVFSHSVLEGSLDDVKHLRRVLQTEGEKGSQAWKELQGQAVTYLRDQATKGVARDPRGNEIVSPAGLNKAVRDLDSSGKLDFLFGKQGAQQIRDLNDLAKDLTAPPGVVNTSNSSSAVLDGLKDMGAALVHGKFGAVMKVGDIIKKARAETKLNARVRDALEQP